MHETLQPARAQNLAKTNGCVIMCYLDVFTSCAESLKLLLPHKRDEPYRNHGGKNPKCFCVIS